MNQTLSTILTNYKSGNFTVIGQGQLPDNEIALIEEGIKFIVYKWLTDHNRTKNLNLLTNVFSVKGIDNLKDVSSKELYEWIYNDKYHEYHFKDK